MRCPKCGYISFDQITNCLRCNKDIGKVAEEVNGSVFNAVAPDYLVFAQEDAAQEREGDQRGEDGGGGIPDEDFFLGESLADEALRGDDVALDQTPDEGEREIEIDIDFPTPLAKSQQEVVSDFSTDKEEKKSDDLDMNYDLELDLGDLDLGLDKK